MYYSVSRGNFPSKAARFGSANWYIYPTSYPWDGTPLKGKLFTIGYDRSGVDYKTIAKDCLNHAGFTPARIGWHAGDYVCFENEADWEAWKGE